MKKKKITDRRFLKLTLDKITSQQDAPTFVFVIILVTYMITAATISITARSQSSVTLFGISLPIYSFAGVLSSLSQLCVVFMTCYCGKKGYFTSLVLLIVQLPFIIMGIVVQHTIASLPGVFGNLLAMVAITIIYFKTKRAKEFQDRLRDQAVTDALTGLPNSFAWAELLQALVKKNERFVAVSVDINGFKAINETMGYDIGNKTLCEIASRLKKIADNGVSGTFDFIARISGDEFALAIRKYNSEEDILNTIKTYDSALHKRLTVDNCDFYITASFGYAEFPADAKTRDSVFAFAVAAMKEVKRINSSDNILRFTPDLIKNERSIAVEKKIREALENETIFFNLQPQFDMDHKLRGFETLARMKDTDGNFISPGEFIPVAENIGIIDKVDGMVFRKAAMFFGGLLRKTGADILLSINVSVRHLMMNDFLDEIRDVLKCSGVPAEKLEIEITESIMIESMEKALQCINEIKGMGIKIAIDDFGTGYSSLSYLNSFPADLLKIDKSFIDNMNENEHSKQYVAAIISIGHIMQFDVIAEGVEEPEQLETLKNIGCDFIQGFIWGKPLIPEDAEKLVSDSLQSV